MSHYDDLREADEQASRKRRKSALKNCKHEYIPLRYDSTGKPTHLGCRKCALEKSLERVS